MEVDRAGLGPEFQPAGRHRLRQILVFHSATHARVTYTLNGVIVDKELGPQVFAQPVPTCSETTASRAGESNYQDLWWNPAEPGWGVNLAHQGDIIFATLFSYNASGQPEWLVASDLRREADGSFSGTLYRTTGPRFDAAPWGPVTVTAVGTMRLAFAGGESGTMSYTVNGTSVAKAIQRQVFWSPQPLCRQAGNWSG